MHGLDENAFKTLVSMKGGNHLRDLGIAGMIVLK
jgi:hypothetical protein